MRCVSSFLLALLTSWLVACGDDDGAAATSLAQSTRDQWRTLCMCDPQAWVCELVDDDAVFVCVEDVVAEHQDEQRDKLGCYARESRRFADCYRAHRCDDAKVEECIGGDDSLSAFCGELPTEVDAQLGACFGRDECSDGSNEASCGDGGAR